MSFLAFTDDAVTFPVRKLLSLVNMICSLFYASSQDSLSTTRSLLCFQSDFEQQVNVPDYEITSVHPGVASFYARKSLINSLGRCVS